jgi:hypothetical protein
MTVRRFSYVLREASAIVLKGNAKFAGFKVGSERSPQR